MTSHASVPFVVEVDGDLVTVFFSSRDHDNVSAICSLKFDITSLKVVELGREPVLSKGKLGTFDDSGVMGMCVLRDGDATRLYYVGWNLGVTVPFRNAIGVAKKEKNDSLFKREFDGPIIDRTRDEPHFTASNCVLLDEDVYKIWYLSCTGWSKDGEGKPVHNYHIKYAESVDGINWKREGKVAIDYKDDFEYAISVPRVMKDKDCYRMWFSSRATKKEPTYRIRYAESLDGIHWNRLADPAGLSPSANGWDSEMVCYPFVFDHGVDRYMLYNGNGYGKTGFGLAVLEHQ